MRFAIAAAAVVAAAHASPSAAYRTCDPAAALDEWVANDAWSKAFDQRRFADVDRHFNEVLAALRQGRIDDAEAAFAFSAFDSAKSSRTAAHVDWVTKFPRSEAAHLARAYHHVALASSARGGKFMSETTEAQIIGMNQALQEAALSLANAERLASKPTLAWAKRVQVGMMSGPRGASAEAYRKAIAEDPKSVEVRRQYIVASLPQWGGSVAQVEKVVADARDLAEPQRRFLRAQADHMLGMYHGHVRKDDAAATRHFEQALAVCPAMSQAARALMDIHQRARQPEPMIKAATAFLARHPASGWAYAQRGWALTELQRHGEAMQDYERGSRYGDGHCDYMLGQYYEYGRAPAKQDLKKALEYYGIAAQKGAPKAKAKVEALRRQLGNA